MNGGKGMRVCVCVCACVCVILQYLCELCQRKKGNDGGTGLSLEVRLNNNKSAEPLWGLLHR